MKILVVSLVRSADRRAKISEQLGARGIEFEFLDAVDGNAAPHPYCAGYDKDRFLLNRRRDAAPGELGCYISHLLAWEKCLALNEAIVVLEDDCVIEDNFLEGLAFVQPFLDRVAFIRIEPLESRWFRPSVRGARFSLVKQYKVGMCTTGYIITPTGAAGFLRTARSIGAPIDLYIRQTVLHGQLIHALTPSLVYPTHADTLIGRQIRNVRAKGVVLSVRRFLYKWSCAIRSLTLNLVNAFRRF